MRKRRILSGILMICLLLSSICIPAFAAEQDSKKLEEAIVAAKKIITVPDNFNDFTHYASERETNEGKVIVWRLNWSEKEGKNGFVSASIGENGFLYDYNRYDDDSNKGLAKVSKERAEALAVDFLKEVIPANAAQMRNISKDYNISSGEEYNFTFEKFVNNAPVNFVIVNVGVNKYTGKVTSFNGGNPEIKNIEYPTLSGAIEESVAEKSYIEKLGVNLKYYSYFDYEKKKMNIFAGYSLEDNVNKAIDAKTGQVVSLYKDNQFLFVNKDYANGVGIQSDSLKAKQQLTKEESEEVKNVANLITREKAESILRETSDIITADMKVNDTSLNKNYMNDRYTWNVSFDGAYGEVDAKTGEVLSLGNYNNDNSVSKNISRAEAQSMAENFLKKITPDKFAQTKYSDINNIILKDAVVQEGNVAYFSYVRQVNGIEFSSNSLRVEVDKVKGKVIGYFNNWYDNAIFPDVSKAMGKEAAFNKYKTLSSFGLQYVMLEKNKVELVYNFEDLNDNYIIDPINGVRLDYTGQAYKDNKLPEYTDISGHWCEKTVKELLENGYYIDGEKFNPNMNITQINFFKYMYSPMRNSYTDDEFYDMLVQNGVIKKEEKAPSSSVSNQDAAKFIIRYLGYDKVAVHPEIFNTPFKDNIEEQYKGYAAMCYGLNIIKGDRNGNFNGTHSINNAEAAIIIYNLIKNNTH